MKSWNDMAKELVEMLATGVKKGAEFVSKQFPILAEQIVKYGIVSNVTQLIGWIVVGIICVVVAILGFPNLVSTSIAAQKQDALVMSTLGWGILFILSVGGFIATIYQILLNIQEIQKAIFAPMVYVIEFIKDYSKKEC
jgi:hypothetical protein